MDLDELVFHRWTVQGRATCRHSSPTPVATSLNISDADATTGLAILDEALAATDTFLA